MSDLIKISTDIAEVKTDISWIKEALGQDKNKYASKAEVKTLKWFVFTLLGTIIAGFTRIIAGV